MKLTIKTQREFDRALASGHFAIATDVWFINLPLVATLPELPAATVVRFANLPLVPKDQLVRSGLKVLAL